MESIREEPTVTDKSIISWFSDVIFRLSLKEEYLPWTVSNFVNTEDLLPLDPDIWVVLAPRTFAILENYFDNCIGDKIKFISVHITTLTRKEHMYIDIYISSNSIQVAVELQDRLHLKEEDVYFTKWLDTRNINSVSQLIAAVWKFYNSIEKGTPPPDWMKPF